MKTLENRFDICFVFFTELATDARTLNMARTFVKNGKSVCVVAIGSKTDVERYEKEGITLFPVEESLNQRFWIRWFKFFINSYKFRDAVSAKYYFGMDLYSLFVAKELSRKHNGQLIYDSREIYSALGPLARNLIKQKILSFIERKLVRKVSKIVVSGEMDAEYLKKYFNHNIPYFVVKNLPPYKKPVKSDYIREKFNIPTDTVILLYQGMLLPGRGIVQLVRTLPFFENSVLVLFGEGSHKTRIKYEAESLKVSNRVIFAGVADYDNLHEITCSADIGLCFIRPISTSYNLALPNKLFEYCMAGIPSLISDLPAMRDVAEKYKIGKLISHHSNPKEIAESLKYIFLNKAGYNSSCTQAAKSLSYESQYHIILNIVK